MCRKAIAALIIAIITYLSLEARIINIPADYATIQAGINSSSNGDTVLVQPGTYHERINFNGHSIKLGSLYLIDGDTMHIAATIIDGDSAGTVVIFNQEEDNTTAIKGITIQHGSSGQYSGGGISCYLSDPIISNNIIRENFSNGGGGGIGITLCNVVISDNLIENNATGDENLTCTGGGISCQYSNVQIINNRILNNQAGMIGNRNDGWAGGIYCVYSMVIISGNLIKGNQGSMWGGGIDLYMGDYTVIGNMIIENSCAFGRGGFGGGIACGGNTLLLGNCIARNISDVYGGGVRAVNGTRIINNSIIGNFAGTSSGGIYIEENVEMINTIVRSNAAPSNPNIEVWGGWPEISYSNIEGGWSGIGNIDTDPMFRDPDSDDYQLMAIACGNILDSPCIDAGSPYILDSLLDCSHGLGTTRSDIGAFAGHIEVPHGSNGIIIIPTDYPNIQSGISASSEGDTILVMPGLYRENLHTFSNNITLSSLFLTTHNSDYIASTIIDGNHSGSVISIQQGLDSTTLICGFTIQNGLADGYGGGICCMESDPVICSNIIINNRAYHEYGGVGGGIYCYVNRCLIKDNLICNNSTNSLGGGIAIESGNTKIVNNIVFRNSVGINGLETGGGGIFLNHSNSQLIDNTITENISRGPGGGVYILYNCNPTITNSIIWNNIGGTSPNIGIDSAYSIVTIRYSDIQGGWAGIDNISTDPLFRDPSHNDYLLMAVSCGDSANSPCIDTGDPSIIDSVIGCDWGLGDSRSDIGASKGSLTVPLTDISTTYTEMPGRILLSQNYPNPFNAQTSIQYSLPEQSTVSIDIFDILGRKIETLAEGIQPPGDHQAIWDASRQSSGIYFYRVKAGDKVETKKMVLMK